MMLQPLALSEASVEYAGVPVAVSKLMSMPVSVIALEPDAPLEVAYWPDASMETRMFSTD